MSKPYLNPETNRLTDMPGERNPCVCRRCGGVTGGDPTGDGKMRILRTSVDRWQECDHNDKPEDKLIVLCNKCAKEIIEQHPRLYHKLTPNNPWPGAMAICMRCMFRDGTACLHPDAKANGGPGVMLTIAKPYHAMVDGRNYRGPLTIWPAPAEACKQFAK